MPLLTSHPYGVCAGHQIQRGVGVAHLVGHSVTMPKLTRTNVVAERELKLRAVPPDTAWPRSCYRPVPQHVHPAATMAYPNKSRRYKTFRRLQLQVLPAWIDDPHRTEADSVGAVRSSCTSTTSAFARPRMTNPKCLARVSIGWLSASTSPTSAPVPRARQ